MPESTPSPTPSGDYPSLRVEHVRDALETLIHTGSNFQEHNPVFFLLHIDEQLVNPDFPTSPHLRTYVTQQLLIDLITDEFFKQRKLFGLRPPAEDEPRETALSAIKIDAVQQSAELLGWSQAYYRFVKDTFEFDLEEISHVSAVHERTLRRYHQRIVMRLTEKLIDLERKARTYQRKRRLLARMPQIMAQHLIGRDNVLDRIFHARNKGELHLYVTGDAGVGKTALVQSIVQQQIEADQLDELYWIDFPISIQFVQESIIQERFPESSQISLREYLIMRHVVVVLDNADALFNDTEALEDFLEYFNSASVYIVTRTYHPLKNAGFHLPLHALDRPQTEALAQYLATSEYDSFEDIWERTGGNPFLIKMLVRNPEYIEVVDDTTMQRLLAMHYNTLSPEEKLCCLIFLLCPPEAIAVSLLARLWPRHFALPALSILVARQLVEAGLADTVMMPASVRSFVENLVQHNPEQLIRLQILIDELETEFQEKRSEALPIVEHILMSPWIALDDARRLHWVEQFVADGINQGHAAVWRAILENTDYQKPQLVIFYGICLRRLAQWELAEATLTQAIIHTGSVGQFVDQARASLELAVLLRYKGKYDKALELINRTIRVAVQYRDARLTNQAWLEKAQISIDAGDGDASLQILASLPDSIRVLTLRSEASLLLRDWNSSISYAQRALSSVGDDKSAAGRIHALLGRIYSVKGENEAAKRYLELAVTLLDQTQDIFALARAQSNLAAHLIHNNALDDAQQLLLNAEKTHRLLKDQLALQTTQHNLKIVRLRLADANSQRKRLSGSL